MQYEVDVNGRRRTVVLSRGGDGRFLVSVDGHAWTVDASRIDGRILSLLLERDGSGAVESRELSVAADPATGRTVVGIAAAAVPVALNTGRRWGRRDEGPSGGPQRIVAPMPGKIARIAAAAGARVAARQPVVVIEAMKMENELRALHAGTVAEILVKEGQSVEAGTLLAIVTPA